MSAISNETYSDERLDLIRQDCDEFQKAYDAFYLEVDETFRSELVGAFSGTKDEVISNMIKIQEKIQALRLFDLPKVHEKLVEMEEKYGDESSMLSRWREYKDEAFDVVENMEYPSKQHKREALSDFRLKYSQQPSLPLSSFKDKVKDFEEYMQNEVPDSFMNQVNMDLMLVDYQNDPSTVRAILQGSLETLKIVEAINADHPMLSDMRSTVNAKKVSKLKLIEEARKTSRFPPNNSTFDREECDRLIEEAKVFLSKHGVVSVLKIGVESDWNEHRSIFGSTIYFAISFAVAVPHAENPELVDVLRYILRSKDRRGEFLFDIGTYSVGTICEMFAANLD